MYPEPKPPFNPFLLIASLSLSSLGSLDGSDEGLDVSGQTIVRVRSVRLAIIGHPECADLVCFDQLRYEGRRRARRPVGEDDRLL